MVGNRRSHIAAPNCRPSSHTCGAPVSRIRRMIALATTSRGARSASGCWPDHEPVAGVVDEEGALAAYGLRDQRLLAAGGGPQPQHGGVELHELHVRHGGAGPQRQGDAVAGGHGWVGGLREDLAEPAGRQHDRTPARRTDALLAALAHHVQRHARGGALGVEQQVQGERVLDDLDRGVAAARRRPAPSTPRPRWRRRPRGRCGCAGGRPRASATARRPRRGRSPPLARSAVVRLPAPR